MTHLVEILLPLTDASGTPFPAAYYDALAKELVTTFGGVTSFLRAPAEGRWHDAGSTEHEGGVVRSGLVDVSQGQTRASVQPGCHPHPGR